MKRKPPLLRACVVAVVMLSVVANEQRAHSADTPLDAQPSPEQLAFFEQRIRPLLAEHCYECHSTRAKKLQAGLRLDSRAGLLAGGDSGPSIAVGDVDGSLLIDAVRYESYEMPPNGKLPEADIQALETWVRMGAPWPDEPEPTGEPTHETFDLAQRRDEHWAWQPVQSPSVPDVQDEQWPRSAIDRFILHGLENAGLSPAVDADRHALVRRACFDLTGLPPTPEQVQRFADDGNPEPFQRLIDELLQSPRFGERWGRHWLDLVRYAESRGHEFDFDITNAFEYRDYVIRAMNADVPYDQLVREHIAGDLIESPRLHPTDGFNESVLGTGFWFLGEWVHSPVDTRKEESDRFDNMIDVMSKAFQGLTVSCARCHDHKFDAISTADYYALSGFLQSSDYHLIRYETLEHNRKIAKEIADVDQTYRSRVAEFLPSTDVQVGFAPQKLHDETAAFRQKVVVDYGQVQHGEFMQNGYLFGDRPRRAGEPYLAGDGGASTIRFSPRSAAASDPAWKNLRSIEPDYQPVEKTSQSRSQLLSIPRAGRTLRTPTFELTQPIVHCRVRGKGHVFACVDSHRLIVAPLHLETIQEINPDNAWKTLHLPLHVGHRLHLEFTPALGESLEVSLVLQGATDEDLRAVEARESQVEQQTAQFTVGLEQYLAANETVKRAFDDIAREWSTRRHELQQQIEQVSKLAFAMLDGTAEDDHVLVRGSSANPGERVPRKFLTAIAGDKPPSIATGSGRLQLAAAINDPRNPLTRRVIVNRVWHHLMGRGIVATTDDFGLMGEKPTHPELLDYLATEFSNDGQSIKRLIRTIMLSRTYQMSSQSSADAVLADPNNRLWHHRPPKRLEGEVIRDALLAVSGQLDRQMFGPSIPVHLTDFMTGRGRPTESGPLNGNNRRSIYLAIRRNFLSPFMMAFDAPTPFSSMGRRTVSNVPAQALILMNDPLVAELTDKWAERALSDSPATDSFQPDERVQAMYLTAFGRSPTESEQAAASQFLANQAKQRNVEPTDRQLWADFAHALVNAKEFIFLR